MSKTVTIVINAEQLEQISKALLSLTESMSKISLLSAGIEYHLSLMRGYHRCRSLRTGSLMREELWAT